MANIVEKIKDELTVEKVLIKAIKTPGVKIKREVFLRKELIKYCPEEIVNVAIEKNPAKAGVSREIINKLSRSVINYEAGKATAISVAASLPSSIAPLAAVGSASVDITSYFAHVFRVVQELAYLYGFDQFNLEDDSVDSETMNVLMVFIGVMFGVQGANAALQKMAATFAVHVQKELAKQSLTKTTIYPIVKVIAKKVGVRMTKQIFADSIASAIPVAGSIASGGLTYAMFRPCCMKLRKKLMEYVLCDPDFYRVVDGQYTEKPAEFNEEDTCFSREVPADVEITGTVEGVKSSGKTVYIAAKGKTYHLNKKEAGNNPVVLSREDAEASGYKPCKRCAAKYAHIQ